MYKKRIRKKNNGSFKENKKIRDGGSFKKVRERIGSFNIVVGMELGM